MADYIDQFLQAMDLITNERIRNAKYDKTIVCNIVSNKDAKNGIYIVSDGASRFEAQYNDHGDILKEGQAVNVLVPENNYNNIKTILGKVVTDTSESFTYVSPLDKFFDMTGSVFTEIDEASLLANDPRGISDVNPLHRGDRLTLVDSVDLSNRDLKGYTRMALSGDFKSYIPNAVSGNYGLYLELITQTIDSGTGTQTQNHTRNFVLDSSDMWGNPYNFGTWFNQAVVFNIEDFLPEEKITRATLYFYQGKNFLLDNNERLPYSLDDDNNYLLDNLFVKNIKLSFGYTTTDKESIYIYTNNGLDYKPDNAPEVNRKTVYLRWNHIIDIETKEVAAITSIDLVNKYVKTDDNEVNIEWFRYNPNYKENIGLGKGWEKVLDNSFSYTFDPDNTKNKEYIRARVSIIDTAGLKEANEQYYDQLEYKNEQIAKVQKDIDIKTSQYNYYIGLPDAAVYSQDIDTVQEEIDNNNKLLQSLLLERDSIKLVEAEFKTTLTSSILEFANEVQVATPGEYDAINGLKLECINQSNGVFRLYDTLTNDLITPSLQYHNYNLRISFNILNEDIEKPQGIGLVRWYIPKNNTMIQAPVSGENYKTEPGSEYIIADNDDYFIISRHTPILKYTDASEEDIEQVHCELNQTFRIKPHLLQSCSNNSIKCEIVRNNITYTASINLEFGNAGTNGTNNTLILSYGVIHGLGVIGAAEQQTFDSSYEAWTANETDHFDLQAKLFNSKDEEIEFNTSNGKWEFLFNQGNYSISNNVLTKKDNSHGGCILKYTVNETIESSYNWVTKYTGYLIIPYRTSSSVRDFVGADRVLYGSAGTRDNYYKEPYKLNGARVNNAQMYCVGYSNPIIKNNKNVDLALNYLPYIDEKDFTIKPRSLFFNDVDYNIYAKLDCNEGSWYQPILVIQNSWSSSVLNNWNGEFSIDETNGTILGTMLGAGKKDSNNRFEGVLMGDVRKGAEDTEAGTGLFGYKDGVQSFGFLTGGTAFLGKAAKAQIKFDGEDGTIMNANYNNGTGIKISMSGNEDAKQSISIKKNHNINGTIKGVEHVLISSDNPYLRIKSDLDNTLLYVGNNDYYLQTDNYSDSNDGARIDLGSGKVRIKAKSGDNTLDINSAASTYPFNINNTFKINWNGAFSASNNNFKVNEDGSITATAGNIGGWDIDSTTLSGGGTTLNSNGTIICNNLIASNTGTIGNFTINGDSLSGGTISGGFISGGSINIGNGKFTVNRGGNYYTTTTGLNVGSGGLQVSNAGINANGDISTDSIVNSKYGYQVNGTAGRDDNITFTYYYESDVSGRTITLTKARMTLEMSGGIIVGAHAEDISNTSLTIGVI